MSKLCQRQPLGWKCTRDEHEDERCDAVRDPVFPLPTYSIEDGCSAEAISLVLIANELAELRRLSQERNDLLRAQNCTISSELAKLHGHFAEIGKTVPAEPDYEWEVGIHADNTTATVYHFGYKLGDVVMHLPNTPRPPAGYEVIYKGKTVAILGAVGQLLAEVEPFRLGQEGAAPKWREK